MKIYLYPLLDQENGGIIDSNNLKLEDNKITSIGTKSFEFNKGILFDSSIPHRNAPICNNYWGTNVTDSPLCFTVFMNTT